ncbi:hypothetical protein LCGC14_2780770, partial [marine sediment metagenome]
GQIDIVIGTHRLLSKDVRFAELGLVVIDEEQRFGVAHKEHLKGLRAALDVLTLTATPIPRTLHMALLGLRDISSLATPPMDRRAIHTEVCLNDEGLVRSAILRELNRDGQIFFVHNRVQDIDSVAHHVQRLVPDARVAIGHGQMPGRSLEGVMLRFCRGEIDVLVCTTIIESGLDIPSANTLIVERADQLGLAQAYQIRGRVGRSHERAYAYLLYPSAEVLTRDAASRLATLSDYTELGSGFKIAMRDLEIRGAGNLLGDEQSGHVAAVGFELYMQMLDEAVTLADNWYATDEDRLAGLEAQGARVETADIRSGADLHRLLADRPARVYLLAAQASRPLSEREPDYTEETNVTGVRRTAEALLAAHAPPLVFASSLHVYGRSLKGEVTPDRPYGAQDDLAHLSKVWGELCLGMY